jgi:hypothetical protein
MEREREEEEEDTRKDFCACGFPRKSLRCEKKEK